MSYFCLIYFVQRERQDLLSIVFPLLESKKQQQRKGFWCLKLSCVGTHIQFFCCMIAATNWRNNVTVMRLLFVLELLFSNCTSFYLRNSKKEYFLSILLSYFEFYFTKMHTNIIKQPFRAAMAQRFSGSILGYTYQLILGIQTLVVVLIETEGFRPFASTSLIHCAGLWLLAQAVLPTNISPTGRLTDKTLP